MTKHTRISRNNSDKYIKTSLCGKDILNYYKNRLTINYNSNKIKIMGWGKITLGFIIEVRLAIRLAASKKIIFKFRKDVCKTKNRFTFLFSI